MKDKAIDSWIAFFKGILDMPLDDSLTSYTEDTKEIVRRNKSVFWKIKGVAARVV